MSILALDLGTTTGYAIRSTTGVYSGSQSFKQTRFEGGGMRFLKFRRWLTEMSQGYEPIEEIYFEEVRNHKGVDAAHAYGGYLATLQAWAEQHDIPYSGVSVGTIKKHATGHGNAGKQAVIEAMEAQGYYPKDDNEADALALLEYIICECF